MRTTLSDYRADYGADCTVQPTSRRSGSTRLLRLFCGGMLVLGLGVFGNGCGNDLATDEAAIAHEVSTMIEQGPSAVQEIYVYDVDGSDQVSVDPSSVDPSGVDPNTGTTTDPAGGDPSTGTGGCTPKPPTPPTPPMPPPTPMCVKEKQGGATSCKDEKTWRSYGEAYCKMKGLVLKNTTFDTSCGRGEWRFATYECCKASPPPPPPPPPPGPRCTNTKASDGRTCKDRAAWKAEGAKFCASKMAILTVLTLEDRCGMGDTWKTAHFECCGWTPPPPPPPPPPPMCVGAGAGGPGVCKSQADWKAEADKTCSARGLTLKNVTYGTACRRPDGSPGHSDIKFECCPGTPPPPPPMCITQSVSDPSVCKSEADWKTAGEAFCKAKMLTLKSVKVGAACTGPMTRGYSGATFECCPGTPPPPPPMCVKYTDGGTTTTCKSDGDWKMSGERYCASKMLTLKNITFGMACTLMGARGFNSATYECCPGTPPPPPPPPMCTTDLVGGAGVCRSEADWKMAAEAFCKMKGATLKNIGFGAACMSGMTRGYSEAKIECCK